MIVAHVAHLSVGSSLDASSLPSFETSPFSFRLLVEAKNARATADQIHARCQLGLLVSQVNPKTRFVEE